MKNIFLLLVLSVAAENFSYAQNSLASSVKQRNELPSFQTLTSEQIHRIGDYGKLWNVLYFFHPAMAYNIIAPDSLFTSNINELLQNPSAASFKNAVSKMIDMLNDPYTTIIDDTQKDTAHIEPRQQINWLADSVAMVYFNEDFLYQNTINYDAPLKALLDSVKNAHALIFDLRKSCKSSEMDDYYQSSLMQSLISYTADHEVAYPSMRTRIHFGYESDVTLEHRYNKGWNLQNGYVVLNEGKLINCPVALLINRFNKNVSDAVACMQYDKIAKVVADGSPGNFEPHDFYKLELTDGVSVNVRLSEIIYPNDNAAFAPDTIVQTSNTSSAANNLIAAALHLLHHNTQIQHTNFAMQNYFASKKMNFYEDLFYPPADLRLFALIRYWGIINYFNPNKDRITKNWDSVLYDYVPKFLYAKDSLQYMNTAAWLIKEINDGHAFFYSPLVQRMFVMSPEIQLDYVESKTIIYKVFNDSLSKFLSAGDEIIKVNDIAVNKFRDSIAQYLSASNNASLQRNVTALLLPGKAGDPVKITVYHNGVIKNLVLQRNSMHPNFLKPREGATWEKINDTIGYVDLGKLQVNEIDSMFHELKNTDAIIFDDRSYPNLTAWTIKDYFTKQKVYPAIFTMMIAGSPSPNTVIKNELLEELLPDTTKPQYKGKIIVLVNEITQSQAEFSCMIFQAASKKVTIIGSQTAGADGNTALIVLPGGIETGFSGLGVHYPDGRPTQGIGIIPDIKVSPTIKGVKDGRDEVLERAIEFVKTGK